MFVRRLTAVLGALLCAGGLWASERIERGGARTPVLDAWMGTTPEVDGVISPGEYADATPLLGVGGWAARFHPTRDAGDLALRGWVKHDGVRLFFAFEVTDDVLYGVHTERWLPADNPHAHELSRRGYPWFGDGMEILLNPAGRWQGEESVFGDATSWRMVCNLTKSRLIGVGFGGLLEGEPSVSEGAWETYQRWIYEGSQECTVGVLPGRRGYVLEWAIHFADCVEVEPGVHWQPELGPRILGLNLALVDLDHPEAGAGSFANFHHQDWWAGASDVQTQLRHFGRLLLRPTPRP